MRPLELAYDVLKLTFTVIRHTQDARRNTDHISYLARGRTHNLFMKRQVFTRVINEVQLLHEVRHAYPDLSRRGEGLILRRLCFMIEFVNRCDMRRLFERLNR